MRIGIGHAALDSETGRLEAAARAVARALLGAAGLGDADAAPGREPGSADSLDALSGAVRAVEGENYQVVNVDLASIDAAPGDRETHGAGPHDDAIRRELADRLHVSPGHVSLDPGGGRSVTAVALLDHIAPMDQVHSALRAGG